ncbi:MAG TPA: four helix bundle protein, partial [Anaerolineales bacterium]|nr:four helix bundle protein [Anaerolineales bacterium]
VSERKPLYQSPGEKGKRGFEDLECYQLALEVMAKVHAFSKTLPPDEKFDLYAQIRRSAKGVTGNIGEGYGRYHYLDSLRFYSTARGELNETLARLIDARVLSYIQQPEFEELYKLIRQAEQTLNGYMNYVRRQRAGSQEFGDKAVREDQADYDLTILDDNGKDQTL